MPNPDLASVTGRDASNAPPIIATSLGRSSGAEATTGNERNVESFTGSPRLGVNRAPFGKYVAAFQRNATPLHESSSRPVQTCATPSVAPYGKAGKCSHVFEAARYTRSSKIAPLPVQKARLPTRPVRSAGT